MSLHPNYITPEGLAALKREFEELFRKERPALVETVAWAAGNGDRSENGDYIYGKKRLREIDRRLRHLGKRIESAQVVDPKTLNSKTVVFGATVTFVGESEIERTYKIVGEDEIDTQKGHISWRSPVARALIGKAIGDEVEVKKPSGISCVEILKIEFC